jgi:hypothetical protein
MCDIKTLNLFFLIFWIDMDQLMWFKTQFFN